MRRIVLRFVLTISIILFSLYRLWAVHQPRIGPIGDGTISKWTYISIFSGLLVGICGLVIGALVLMHRRRSNIDRADAIRINPRGEPAMEVVVRFGQVSDKRQISSLDKHIRDKVLNWKLQHQEIIVAVGEDGIVGYVRVEYLWSKYPYIGLILVREKYQRLGIGKKLLSFLETHLNKQGISLLYSSSQANEHEPQQWHKHMGFVECGIINGINDGIGEVFFVKDLREAIE